MPPIQFIIKVTVIIQRQTIWMINPLYKTPLERLSTLWSYITEDPLKQDFELRNSPYISRQFHLDIERRNQYYVESIKRFNDKVSLVDILNDNYLRFSVLGFLDRLTVLRQTSMFNTFPNARGSDGVFSGLNRIGAQSLVRGAFRGNFLNLMQFFGVHYQALSLSNKNLGAYCVNYVILDALLHPLDTLKTRYQADARGAYKGLADVAAKTAPSQLYNGIMFRVGFSSLMAMYFSSISSTCFSSPSSIALLIAAYPLLTLKSIAQVANTSGTFVADIGSVTRLLNGEAGLSLVRHLYRGFIPFLALNSLAPYAFPQIWTERKQKAIVDKFDDNLREQAAINAGVY